MESVKTISVKGMVCDRCKTILSEVFKGLGLEVVSVQLGSLTLAGNTSLITESSIKEILQSNGFEFLKNRQTTLVEETKRIIGQVFDLIEHDGLQLKFSQFLVEKLGVDYATISSSFSGSENITLEKYIINIRLEKVKELLVYTDFTLTEIAFVTNFSSVHHLSNHFKDLVGLSPSHFRKIKIAKQSNIKSSAH